MRYVAILGIVCLGTMGLISGCSDGETGTTGGAGGSGNASSSSSSSGGGMGGGSSSSSSGEGGSMASSSSSSSGGMLINGCDKATAEDHTADAVTKVAVGMGGFSFSPACIRIKKGADVTFEGNFSFHPLVGGVASIPPMPDSSSPIKQTNAGMSATFTFDLAGTYPYYCEYHTPNMAGVVFVE